jgi:hypothetical protein
VLETATVKSGMTNEEFWPLALTGEPSEHAGGSLG